MMFAHQLFLSHAERAPESPALLHAGRSTSYAELSARSGEISARLSEYERGAIVAVRLPRGPDLPAAVLGIWRAGCACLLVDLAHPVERQREIIADSGARLTMSTAAVDPLHGSPQVLVENTGGQGTPVAVHPAEDDPAYVVYTSGSTGRPKGVVVGHGSLAALHRGQGQLLGVTTADRVLQFAAVGFDAIFWELSMSLLSGAALVLPGDEDERTHGLAELVRRTGITIATLPPSALSRLFGPGQVPPTVVTAGEACPPGLARALAGSTRLINAYGPAETTVCATARVVPEHGPASIGWPFGESKVYVLDARLRPVPTGEVGEIYVGGPGVGQGYLGQSALTAERFLPDPFGGTPGARMYRTGDLGRVLPDSSLDFRGRADHQVKIRGVRVECLEVEHHLRACDGVLDAVVLAQPGPDGEPRLAGYVTGEVAPEELRARLARRLPAQLVPAAITVLAELPLNVNGKVDRAALPAPAWARAAAYAAPRTEPTREIAAIWAESLGREVGLTDNFFDLGGDSLSAAGMLALLAERTGLAVSLAVLFEHPTLGEFAEHARSAAAPDPRPVGSGAESSLSRGQLGLWILDQVEPDSTAYVNPVSVTFQGVLDVPVLARCLTGVLRRYPILRSVFRETEAGVRRMIRPVEDVVLPVVDRTTVPPEGREAELRRLAEREVASSFDLANGPLLRARVVEFGGDQWALVLVVHHIVADGWSLSVIMNDLAARYPALLAGDEPELAAAPPDFADYIETERANLTGERFDQSLDYWRRRLGGLPPVAPPSRRASGATLEFDLPSAATVRLRELARSRSITDFTVLLAIVAVLVSRSTGEDDLVLGVSTGHRPPRFHTTVGHFVNLIPFRVWTGGNPTFAELLDRVAATWTADLEHAGVPFDVLVERTELGTYTGRPGGPRTVVAPQRVPPMPPAFGELPVRIREMRVTEAKFGLTVGFEPGDTVRLFLTYRENVVPRRTVEAMATWLTTSLPELTGSTHVSRLTDREEELPHRMFLDQADRTPDAPAIIHNGQTWTYADVAGLARRVAYALRAHGDRPLVAVRLPRGPRLIAAMLGTWLAGGSYLPLDIGHPVERLRQLAEDAAADVVLSSAAQAPDLPGIPHVLVEELPEREVPLPESTVDDSAYVIYTSGSTGTAKGVMISHGGLMTRMSWRAKRFPLGPGDSMVAKIPVGFDGSLWELLFPLLHGARVVFPAEGAEADPARIAELVADSGAAVLQVPPPVLAGLVDEPGFEQCTALRHIVCGADELHWDVVDKVVARLPGVRVHNTYGATETSILATCHPDVAEVTVRARIAPVGWPVAGARIYVLDPGLAPVPPGTTGEIYVGGTGLAVGYRGRPALTAERFLPDPFRGTPGARMYRTGDLGRLAPDGGLEFLGRADHQVKIRGMRVEPAEVEHQLRACDHVLDAVVVGRPGPAGDLRLAAYLVTAEDHEVARTRQRLAARLPGQLVPAAFTVLPRLPLTRTGKVDRAALPEPEWTVNARHAEPRTDLQRQIAAAWAEVLRQPRIGLTDNFFDLGGNSMLLIRLRQLIEHRLGVRLAMVTLFRTPTVDALAAYLSHDLPSTGTTGRGAARGAARRARHRNRRRTPEGR